MPTAKADGLFLSPEAAAQRFKQLQLLKKKHTSRSLIEGCTVIDDADKNNKAEVTEEAVRLLFSLRLNKHLQQHITQPAGRSALFLHGRQSSGDDVNVERLYRRQRIILKLDVWNSLTGSVFERRCNIFGKRWK